MRLLVLSLLLQLLLPQTVEIPAGSFEMGSPAPAEIRDERDQFDLDEGPVHSVTLSQAFRMGVTEVTNAQYEQYDPSHRALRGRQGFSTGDDEAVVFVSWEDAMGYCRWLSEKTGQTWRLPTEAEWEYACRAGTTTAFSYGDTLPEGLLKFNEEDFHKKHIFRPVDLTVACGAAPNAFGLYDMHGNVEEWCLDGYGPYPSEAQTDPVGRWGFAGGETDDGSAWCRVTRGGSHSTEPRFLRSAARSAALPEDRSYLIGFRVISAPYPATFAVGPERQGGLDLREHSPEGVHSLLPEVQSPLSGTSSSTPFFAKPIPYVREAPEDVVMYHHNHEPAVAACPDGSVFAIWFSCASENGREMVILSSRLEAGADEWSAPQPFFRIPDRNLTGCSLFYDESQGALIHLGGIEASGWWRNLAIARRFSYDGGRTWTKPEIVNGNHDVGNQLVAGMSRTADGTLIQVCDADPGGVAGSVIHISRDGGETWQRRGDPNNFEFKEGGMGPNIAGIHAGVVELMDGRLMAFGRGVRIPDAAGVDRMPVSYSSDQGETWTYHASVFPPIRSGQRLVLMRLREGPILLVSFDDHGMFASLSNDEGATWTAPKLLTDGSGLTLEGGAWTGSFTLDSTHAEPKGYLAATQTPDGIIHLISSKNHYRFNLAWLER